jgi:hypothetical protein
MTSAPSDFTRTSQKKRHNGKKKGEPTCTTVAGWRSCVAQLADVALKLGLCPRQSLYSPSLRALGQMLHCIFPWPLSPSSWCCKGYPPASASMLAVDVFRCSACGGVMRASWGECRGRSRGGVFVALWVARTPFVKLAIPWSCGESSELMSILAGLPGVSSLDPRCCSSLLVLVQAHRYRDVLWAESEADGVTSGGRHGTVESRASPRWVVK